MSLCADLGSIFEFAWQLFAGFTFPRSGRVACDDVCVSDADWTFSAALCRDGLLEVISWGIHLLVCELLVSGWYFNFVVVLFVVSFVLHHNSSAQIFSACLS